MPHPILLLPLHFQPLSSFPFLSLLTLTPEDAHHLDVDDEGNATSEENDHIWKEQAEDIRNREVKSRRNRESMK